MHHCKVGDLSQTQRVEPIAMMKSILHISAARARVLNLELLNVGQKSKT